MHCCASVHLRDLTSFLNLTNCNQSCTSCGSLGAISMHYHRDNELLERQAAFMDLCRTAFLRAVQDARAIQLSQSTSGKLVLQSEGELSLPVSCFGLVFFCLV